MTAAEVLGAGAGVVAGGVGEVVVCTCVGVSGRSLVVALVVVHAVARMRPRVRMVSSILTIGGAARGRWLGGARSSWWRAG